MTIIEIDVFEPIFGIYAGKKKMKVHDEDACHGDYCAIHRPSDHPLREAPLQWRGDRGLMERRCAHEIGHPDPDDVAFKKMVMTAKQFSSCAFEEHGCDGCCR